jgi:hypothetical protein
MGQRSHASLTFGVSSPLVRACATPPVALLVQHADDESRRNALRRERDMDNNAASNIIGTALGSPQEESLVASLTRIQRADVGVGSGDLFALRQT